MKMLKHMRSDLITREILSCVYRHALEEYPLECCGMILASGAVRVCRNAQDDLHACDPESFPRTARDGYTFSIDDQLFLAESMAGPDPVRVVYHSHPDGDARLSRTDHDLAMPDHQPLYPYLKYLVIACRSEHVESSVLFGCEGKSYCEQARFSGMHRREL